MTLAPAGGMRVSVDMTLWSSAAWSSAADLELLGRARDGSAEAFGELWRRHLPAAYAVASRYRGRSSAEDIVAEASARVLSLIQDGKGPEEHFRSYFLTAVKTVAVDNARRDLRVVPAESQDLEALTEPVLEDFPGDGIDADLVREAFAGLSERDRRVLWHTTVEGEAPRTVAPVLGMTANAVSASAMRAREALRAHYLDAHASRRARTADSDECRWTMDHLGAHVRGRLPKRQAQRVRAHLEQCPHAATVAAELTEINAGFPALLVPLILLAGVSTPGFVSAGALAGLSAGAVSAAAGPVVGGSGGPGSSAAGSPAGSSSAGSSSVASSSSQVVLVGQQVATVASSIAAAAVIGAGVVSASPSIVHGPFPGAPSVAAPSVPTPTGPGPSSGGPVAGAAPGARGGAGPSALSGATGSPSGVRRAPSVAPAGSVANIAAPGGAASGGAAAGGPAGAGAGGVGAAGGSGPSVGAGGASGAVGSSAATGTPVAPQTNPPAGSGTAGSSGGPKPPSTSQSGSQPGGSSSSTSSSAPSGPSPTSTPSSTPSSPPSSSTTSQLPSRLRVLGHVSADGSAWIQIPGASAGLRVTLTNRFGGGTLTAENHAWACQGNGTARLSCTVKSEGRFKLVQAGLPAATPIVVTLPTLLGLTFVVPVGR